MTPSRGPPRRVSHPWLSESRVATPNEPKLPFGASMQVVAVKINQLARDGVMLTRPAGSFRASRPV